MTGSMILALAGITIVSYLLGSIPSGYLLGRSKGVDLRREGSGNIGATNAGRVLGVKYFYLVMVLDLVKGLVPVMVASQAWPYLTAEPFAYAGLVAGLAAIVGHDFSIYLRFQGGKGVATSAGAFLGLCPLALGVALAVWLVVGLISGYSSVASLLASVVLPSTLMGLSSDPWGTDLPLLVAAIVAAGLVFIRHRANIKRLWKGEESLSNLFRPGREHLIQD